MLAGLAGLLEGGESEGALRVDGLDPRRARDRTGIVFQDPESQLVMARSGDEVAFGLENRCVPAAEIWPRVDGALAAVGFPYGRDRPTDALSGGEQQRLALAGTLALQPGLLLLDEPTANLDPGRRGARSRCLAPRPGRRRTDAGPGRASGRGCVAARGPRDRAGGRRWRHRRWAAGGGLRSPRRRAGGGRGLGAGPPAADSRPRRATNSGRRGHGRSGPGQLSAIPGEPGLAVGPLDLQLQSRRGAGDRRAERIGQVDPGAPPRRAAAPDARHGARGRGAGVAFAPRGDLAMAREGSRSAGSDRSSRIPSTSS